MAFMLNNLRQIRPLAACVPLGVFDSNVLTSNGFIPNLLALRGFNPERFLANFDSFDPVPGLRERKMEIEAPKPFPQQKISETSKLSWQGPHDRLSYLVSTMTTSLIGQIQMLLYARELQCLVRHVTIDDHKPNEQLKIPLESLGLQADAGNPGWYKLPNQENPFRVSNVNGQLLWRAVDTVTYKHMIKITDFYRDTKELKTRGIHINTGTHGDEKGTPVPKGSSDFISQDIEIAKWAVNWISIGIVTSFHPPMTHDKIPDLDIIDAWCWSIRTQDTEAIKRNSIPRLDIWRSYS